MSLDVTGLVSYHNAAELRDTEVSWNSKLPRSFFLSMSRLAFILLFSYQLPLPAEYFISCYITYFVELAREGSMSPLFCVSHIILEGTGRGVERRCH